MESGPGAGTNTKEPGILIFTGNHYSMTISISNTRTQMADPTKATAAELMALYGPFIANAGTYEISGETVTTQATVAKNPGVTKRPPIKHSFHIDGDTLTLTGSTLQMTLKRLE